jgi:hypothetical protein
LDEAAVKAEPLLASVVVPPPQATKVSATAAATIVKAKAVRLACPGFANVGSMGSPVVRALRWVVVFDVMVRSCKACPG